VIVWVIGVWTTWLFVSALAVPEPFLVALALQSALTAAQSAFWAGKRDTLALAAVGIDALINYGGLYPYLQNISATPTYTQLSSAFDFIPATAPQWVVGSFSLAICIIIAGLPELLWKRGRRSRE
jgi:hypothetical protein